MSLTQFVAQSNDWNHMNGWGDGWMWLWGVAIMAGLVVLVWRLASVSSAAPGGAVTSSDPTRHAKEILADRFASGELSSEEYRERLDELR